MPSNEVEVQQQAAFHLGTGPWAESSDLLHLNAKIVY